MDADTERPNPHKERWLALACLFGLLALTFYSYYPSTKIAYHVDDHRNLAHASPPGFQWDWIFDMRHDAFLPISRIYYDITYPLFGNEPAGYHWIGIFVHLANIALTYLAFAQIFRNRWMGLGVALAFGMTSAHAATTMLLATRGFLLSVSGYLAAIYFFVKAIRSTTARNFGLYLLGATLAHLFVLYSYG